MTKLLAHRGTARNSDGEKVKEHSMASYEAAIDFGADYVEVDLYITKDGVVITSHADHNFANLTYDEVIKKYPTVARFSDVVDMVKERSIETGRDVGLTIEIKDGKTVEATQQAASAAIDILVEKGFTDPDKLYINSFNMKTLQYIHDEVYTNNPELSEIPLIKIVSTWSVIGSEFRHAKTSMEKAYSNTFHGEGTENVDGFAFDIAVSAIKTMADFAHEDGKELHTWTSGKGASEKHFYKLLDKGVDAIYADDTQKARTAFEKYDGMQGVEYGKKGDDAISVKDKTTVYAMQGDDAISISGSNNKIYADGGNDTITNTGDNNYINGGGGDDTILSSGSGNKIYGGAGNNKIYFSSDDVAIYDHNSDGNNLLVGDGAINIEGYDVDELSFREQGRDLVINFNDGGEVVVQNGVDANGHVANQITVEGNKLDIDSYLIQGEAISPAEFAQQTPVELNGLGTMELALVY